MIKITNSLDIPGETTKKQHDWFYKVYHWMYPPHRILEVGCAWGRSTWAWLDCIEHERSYLEVLDNWSYTNATKQIKKHNNDYYDNMKLISPTLDQKEILLYNLQQHPNYSKLKKIHTGDSTSFVNVPNALTKYDIVYLDGDHSEKNVYNELNYFNGSKVICGDDFNMDQSGVIKAVCKFYSENYKRYYLYTDPEARFFALKRVDL